MQCNMMMQIENSTVLITGACGGIGSSLLAITGSSLSMMNLIPPLALSPRNDSLNS